MCERFLNQWYDNTLRSRLNYQEEGAIVIVMQRLHADDLVATSNEPANGMLFHFPLSLKNTPWTTLRTPYGRRLFHRREGDIFFIQPLCHVPLWTICAIP